MLSLIQGRRCLRTQLFSPQSPFSGCLWNFQPHHTVEFTPHFICLGQFPEVSSCHILKLTMTWSTDSRSGVFLHMLHLLSADWKLSVSKQTNVTKTHRDEGTCDPEQRCVTHWCVFNKIYQTLIHTQYLLVDQFIVGLDTNMRFVD